jgi:hypothetical protein
MVLFQETIRFQISNAILFLSLISGEIQIIWTSSKGAAISKQLNLFYRLYAHRKRNRNCCNVVKNNTFGQE